MTNFSELNDVNVLVTWIKVKQNQYR